MQPNTVVIAVFQFVILLFSLSVHECAHAWMASRLGDQTARMQGRVTLNPLPHIDTLGTIIYPLFLIVVGLVYPQMRGFIFGWAKPTPVMTRNFKKIVRDDVLTTLAGPVSNLLLAVLGFVGLTAIIKVSGHLPNLETIATNVEALGILCEGAITINLALFFFNLLPFPPLDGSRILRHFLPYSWLNAYDGMGMLSLLLMIVVGSPIVGLLMRPSLYLVQVGLNMVQASVS